jgi:hypothetical protein
MTPKRPNGRLPRLCYDALIMERRRAPADRKNWLGPLDWDVLEQLELAAPKVPALADDLHVVGGLLAKAGGAQLTQEEGIQIRAAYKRAVASTFPATAAVLHWLSQFHNLTTDHSLSAIRTGRLRSFELAALEDPTLAGLLKKFRATLGRAKNVDDSQAFRQAFEDYGEPMVYSLLSERFVTTKVEEQATSMPDFRCELPSGKPFFVELKSFDLVDASYRSKEILDEGLEQHIALEDQLAQGKQVAMAERVITPYKRAFAQRSKQEPGSLLQVINVLADKARSAFKQSQFVQGPTFAFALCDRLLLPGGKHDVAPYYYDRSLDGAVVSGVLWHACFGKTGTPILRFPDVTGKPGLEGYLARDGLLADAALPFHTGGIFFAETTWQEDDVLGLYDPDWKPPGWTTEETEEVMHRLCNAVNDKLNSWGQLVATT